LSCFVPRIHRARISQGHRFRRSAKRGIIATIILEINAFSDEKKV
jgi:hypothetical protein